MSLAERYYIRFAAAFVRGQLSATALRAANKALFAQPLDALTEDDCLRLFELGDSAGLRLHRFKRTQGLWRVERVVGALRGIGPRSILDIGTGRGVFLWPLLEAFGGVPITCIDRLEHRVADLQAAADGGLGSLAVRRMDVTRLDFDDGAHDVVTFLEVLEHIPEAQQALAEAVRVAGRFVVLSVPSQADDNPEHIHLFSKARLQGMLPEAGAERARFDYVPGHLIAVARVRSAREADRSP